MNPNSNHQHTHHNRYSGGQYSYGHGNAHLQGDPSHDRAQHPSNGSRRTMQGQEDRRNEWQWNGQGSLQDQLARQNFLPSSTATSRMLLSQSHASPLTNKLPNFPRYALGMDPQLRQNLQSEDQFLSSARQDSLPQVGPFRVPTENNGNWLQPGQWPRQGPALRTVSQQVMSSSASHSQAMPSSGFFHARQAQQASLPPFNRSTLLGLSESNQNNCLPLLRQDTVRHAASLQGMASSGFFHRNQQGLPLRSIHPNQGIIHPNLAGGVSRQALGASHLLDNQGPPVGLSGNNENHLQQALRAPNRQVMYSSASHQAVSSSGFYRYHPNQQGPPTPLPHINPNLAGSYQGPARPTTQANFCGAAASNFPSSNRHLVQQSQTFQMVDQVKPAPTNCAPVYKNYKECKCGEQYAIKFQRTICPKCYAGEQLLRMQKTRRERAITVDDSSKFPSGLDIIRQPFLRLEHQLSIFHPDEYIFRLNPNGECPSQYVPNDRDIIAGCENIKFSLEWYCHVPSLAMLLEYRGIFPRAREPTEVKYRIVDPKKETGVRLVSEICQHTPSAVSPLTDAVFRISLSVLYPFNAALERLKEDCTRLLEKNPVLLERHEEVYKDWDEEMAVAAMFALMELHPSILRPNFVIMMPHTDKNKFGAAAFYCLSGQSINFFCIKGEPGFADELGDNEIYKKWKATLTSKKERDSVKALETDLLKMGAEHGTPRVVPVHFTPGKRILFDPGHTVHAVISLGIRDLNFLKFDEAATTVEGSSKKPKNNKTRCIGVMYSAYPKPEEKFSRTPPAGYEQASMEEMLRGIMAQPKEWQLDLSGTAAASTNGGVQQAEENQVPLIIVDSKKPAAKKRKNASKKATSQEVPTGPKRRAAAGKSASRKQTSSAAPKSRAAATRKQPRRNKTK